MKIFERQKTDWVGLWKDEDNKMYISPSVNLKPFKDFKGNVRVIVRKNKFYTKGSNRPQMQLMIVDSQSMNAKDIEPYEIKIKDGKKVIAVETAIEIALRMIDDCIYGISQDDLCVEVASMMYANAEE